MAIYGINFNGQPIPDHVAKLFPKRLKIGKNGIMYTVGPDRACTYRLIGVCQSMAELRRMVAQADNSHREFYTRARAGWRALYAG